MQQAVESEVGGREISEQTFVTTAGGNVGPVSFGGPLRVESNSSLPSFSAIWYDVFLWCLFSSLALHLLAAVICAFQLRRHAYGRLFSIPILLLGLIVPLTVGLCSTTVVAFVCAMSKLYITPVYAMLCGVAQTLFHILFGFHRLTGVL